MAVRQYYSTVLRPGQLGTDLSTTFQFKVGLTEIVTFVGVGANLKFFILYLVNVS